MPTTQTTHFIVTHNGVTSRRSSPTVRYTHVICINSHGRALSWHTTKANAEKALGSVQEAAMVVPVETVPTLAEAKRRTGETPAPKTEVTPIPKKTPAAKKAEAKMATVTSIEAKLETESTNRLERQRKAKAEAKALAAWRAAGTGDRPATPNLDALEAQAQDRKPNGTPVIKKARAAAKAPAAKRNVTDMHAQAMAATKAKDGKRGPGTRISDEEFEAYVATQRAHYPTESSYTLMEYAYWIDLLAFSRNRWTAAWSKADK